MQPELGLGLQHTCALAVGDHQREHAREGRLAGAGRTAEDDVQTRPDGGVEERDHSEGQRPGSRKVIEVEEAAQLLLADLDRKWLGDRRKDGIEPAAVAQRDGCLLYTSPSPRD